MNDRRPRAGCVAVMLALLLSEGASAGPLERLSLTPSGGTPSGRSAYPSLSADGRWVSFISEAPNLTPDDPDTKWDVFVRDRETGTTVLVSKSAAGVKGNSDSGDPLSYGVGGPAISGTGRFVAFTSLATNLVPAAPPSGVYVHDRDADDDGVFDEPGAVGTVLVSVTTDGELAPGFGHQFPDISENGRFVAFASTSPLVADDTNGQRDVFVRDRDTDADGIFDEADAVETTRVSVGTGNVQGNGESGRPDLQISADGRIVAFVSYSSNFAPYDTNGVADFFVHDRLTGVTERVNVSSSGRQSTPLYDNYEFGLSGDGRWVAFVSQDIALADGESGYGGVDPQSADILVHDRLTHRTTIWATGAPAGRVHRNSSYRPVLSHDGRLMAFFTRFGADTNGDGSEAKNRIEVWVHDRITGATVMRPILARDGLSETVFARGIAISHDGRTVAFDTEGAVLPSDGNGLRDVFADSCPIAVQGDPAFAFCEPLSFPILAAADQTRFAAGVAEFRHVDGVADGIGPVFNATSCVACHNRPWIGGTSDVAVTHFGTIAPDGGFDPLASLGGPTLQTEGLSIPGCSLPGETIPPAATEMTARDVPALFGAGLLELIPDAMILRSADPDDRNHDGISGRAHMVDGRVGRFGRKAQLATLREFAADAYLEEMGITSPDRPFELPPQGGAVVCDTVADPEDAGGNVARFVDFIRLLAPLPSEQYVTAEVKREGRRGRGVFRRVGCTGCHTEKAKLTSALVRPFGVRKVTPFTDLLLHDLGPALADGIAQGEASGSEFRTSPLWGVGWSAPYMHDGRAPTLADAILAHGGEAQAARDAFAALTPAEKAALTTFLKNI